MQARERCRAQPRWLMVTLHDPSEFPCQILNRDLWKDQSVRDLIRENFCFMQVCGIPYTYAFVCTVGFTDIIQVQCGHGRGQRLPHILPGGHAAAYCRH